MKRRAFLCGLTVGALTTPFIAEAQQTGRVPRVGVFVFTPALKEAFLQGLHDAGYVEGQSIVLEQRVGELSPVPMQKQVAELLELRVDVFVTTGVSVHAVKSATRTVPIVAIDLQTDPIARGFAATYARPGGNLTGLFLDLPELAGKHLQLLREAVPGLNRAAVLWDDRFTGDQFRAIEAASRSTNVTIVSLPVRREDDLKQTLDRLMGERPQALIGLGSAVISRNRKQIAEAALKYRLPSISLYTNYPEVGGLIGYGPNYPGLFRRAANYVDRILKGAHPGDLPIERPTKFDLVINLKTAKALGLTIPPSLLLRADQVIE